MPWNKDGSRKTSTYKMKGSPHKLGTIEGTSAFKAEIEKKTHSTRKDDPNYKNEHNIAAEKLNTTGRWCITCGRERSEHTNVGHAFKVYTPPGPDTKKKK